MKVEDHLIGHALALTPWHVEDPVRVGMYEVALGSDIVARSCWTGSAWSAPCDPAADRHAHARARRTPWNLRGSRPVWRGLTQRSAEWLQAEMAAEMNRD